MPSLQIKNVPEETHAVLRQRAAAAHQSLQEYLRARLIAETSEPTLEEALDRAGGPVVQSRSRRRWRRCGKTVIVVDASVVVVALAGDGVIDGRRAGLALADLAALRLQRAPHRPLLARCWELRENLTIYDSAYVALAEALGTSLLTGNRRLAAAAGPRCPVEVIRPGASAG